MKTKLTDRHQRFVEEYAANGGNGTRAYRLIYPKATLQSAMALSSKLLRDVKVQECLREARKKFLKRVSPTYKRLLHEYGKLAFSDIREVLDFESPGGPYLIPGKQLSPEAAACIQSVEVITTTQPAPKGKSNAKGKAKGQSAPKVGAIATTRTRVRLHSKPDALHKIGLHIGMFEKLTPLEVFINALPPSLGRQVRASIAAATASAKAQPRVGSVGEPDPVPAGDVPGFGQYTGPVAESLPGQQPQSPDGSRVSTGGKEFRDGDQDPPPLFDDP